MTAGWSATSRTYLSTSWAARITRDDPTLNPVMADGHGRRARPRAGPDPRRQRVPHAPARARPAVPRAHQQLDLHPARPGRAAPPHRARRAGGVDLDVVARHRPVPRRP